MICGGIVTMTENFAFFSTLRLLFVRIFGMLADNLWSFSMAFPGYCKGHKDTKPWQVNKFRREKCQNSQSQLWSQQHVCSAHVQTNQTAVSKKNSLLWFQSPSQQSLHTQANTNKTCWRAHRGAPHLRGHEVPNSMGAPLC